jgi:hypothetical protein
LTLDEPSTPTQRLQLPNRRHFLNRIHQKTPAKRQNSVVEPWVDVDGDLAAINSGQAQRQGDRYVINGRTYGVHREGQRATAVPMSGPGVHVLGRMAYKALGIYNDLGCTAPAEEILDRMGVDAADRAEARRVWGLGQRS